MSERGFAATSVRSIAKRAGLSVGDMVDNILAAFREGVDELEWMTPETKKIAKAKESLWPRP